MATNFTSEGEATAHYIGEMLKARGLKVSRLARGVPVGGELEYVDAGTIAPRRSGPALIRGGHRRERGAHTAPRIQEIPERR